MTSPTPDPPPAAPLTAEEIAAIQQYTYYAPVKAAKRLQQLLDSHAALRDRLARAHHALTVVDSVLGNEIADEVENWQVLEAARQIIRTARSTPTDGAARAGDAAGDEGGTDGKD